MIVNLLLFGVLAAVVIGTLLFAFHIFKEEWKEKYNYEVIIGDGKTMVERMFE